MGDTETGEQALRPLQEFGNPVHESVEPKPSSEVGTDVSAEKRDHWKNHYVSELSDAAIDTFVEGAVPLLDELTGFISFLPVEKRTVSMRMRRRIHTARPTIFRKSTVERPRR